MIMIIIIILLHSAFEPFLTGFDGLEHWHSKKVLPSALDYIKLPVLRHGSLMCRTISVTHDVVVVALGER